MSDEHESYWHITEDPHFAPRGEHVPHDNSLSITDRTRSGLYLTKDPNAWAQSHGYQRPYLAEVHVPKGLGGDERYGNERFVEGKDVDKVKVHRVIPLDEHIRENYGEPGRIEAWHQGGHDGREIQRSAWGHSTFKEPLGEGYHYSGPDVRDMPASEHRKHYERWRDYMVGGGNEGHQFGHNEFDDDKMSLGGQDRDEDYDSEGQFIMRDQHGRETGRKWASKAPLTFEAFSKTAHDSGDGETIYHCPFCGSGQVIARSDRTIECEFCHICFTVQVQPQFSAFPQTIDGQPVDVPGMPGQAGVDPAGAGGLPPGVDGAPDGLPGEEDPAAGEEDEEDEEEDGNPFAKASMLRTASGALVSTDDYLAHLALRHTDDREATLALVRSRRER